jgi:hypothetical protein
MTYHFAAWIPERGIGILSDSAVSYKREDGSWSFLESHPKTFVISPNAAIACAGDAPLCLRLVSSVASKIDASAHFDDIVPLVQEAYVAEANLEQPEEVELLLAARCSGKAKGMKLIKYERKRRARGLVRLEKADHYTIGLPLPMLEKELCALLTVNFRRTYSMEKTLGTFLNRAGHIIPSPKSFPLGICFGSLMPAVKEYVDKESLTNVINAPWTILLLPEDGPIHFQSSQMYDGSTSVPPEFIA